MRVRLKKNSCIIIYLISNYATMNKKIYRTECNTQKLLFQDLKTDSNIKKVEADFQGGSITSDAGGLLLREIDSKTNILTDFAACFEDYRNPKKIEHTVTELLAQRIYGICLGYEDLNDHDSLRHDPLLATLCNKTDPTGKNRLNENDKGKALAGKNTLNRLELTPESANEKSMYKKIVFNEEKIKRFFVKKFFQKYKKPPKQIILDVDATDDPVHGNQEDKFFHGYYGCYCYLPLYIFAGNDLLCARLRKADIDASYGTVEELHRIVSMIREKWANTKIIIRGDSGFCREKIMKYCEENGVGYILGLSRNKRLYNKVRKKLKKSRSKYVKTGKAHRQYKQFCYKTLKSWSKSRKVIGKAEYLPKGENPRFIVTTLEGDADNLYEKVYCARGDMENRIKEKQLYLFADRTSTQLLRSNQLRLWFSSVAYVIMSYLRDIGLKGTLLDNAQCETIRLKLFKIGARIKISVRRIYVTMSESYPLQEVFKEVLQNIQFAFSPG